MGLKAGIRADKYQLSKTFKLAPRVSLAYQTSENAQLSVAYGDFYQKANSDILRFNNAISPENAKHYILNYQYANSGRILRLEAYRKNYDDLAKFDTDMPQLTSNYNSNGNGFAQGIDIFFRDNKSIKNVDYWLSYSYLDTERNFRNFPTTAQPTFTNTHNISAVGRYWIGNWQSQVGFSYTFASGRPFNNPNTDQFLAEKQKVSIV